MYDRGTSQISGEEMRVFTSGLWHLGSHVEKEKIGSISPYDKINSKWVMDLNVSDKTTQALKENIGDSL